MKNIDLPVIVPLIVLFFNLVSVSLNACPTCIGALTAKNPHAFFTEKCYEYESLHNADDLDVETLLKEVWPDLM